MNALKIIRSCTPLLARSSTSSVRARFNSTLASPFQQQRQQQRNQSHHRFSQPLLFGVSLTGLAAGCCLIENRQPFQQSRLVVSCDDSVDNKSLVSGDRLKVFAPRVTTLFYRVVLIVVSIASGGLLFIFIAPLLDYNSLEESIPKMSIGGKRLVWTGDFQEYYLLAMKNYFFTACTLGFYSLLGYSELATATYIDEHLMVKQ